MANNGLRRQVSKWLEGSADTGDTNEAVACRLNRLIEARVILTRCLTALGGPVVEHRPEGGPNRAKAETIPEPVSVVDTDTFIVTPEESAMVCETPWNPAYGENFQD